MAIDYHWQTDIMYQVAGPTRLRLDRLGTAESFTSTS